MLTFSIKSVTHFIIEKFKYRLIGTKITINVKKKINLILHSPYACCSRVSTSFFFFFISSNLENFIIYILICTHTTETTANKFIMYVHNLAVFA
ncbi:hypothetical protein PUN28_013208 [Cardiocondyla obscurior]|uniref:Uncharacterized protein n=1 Tax=Cardiocondyla obscurior TaxID=286306 RepID=A0AAW2FBF9_9HYME